MNTDFMFNMCKIIEGALDADFDKVVSYAQQLRTRLDEQGEHEAAKRIQALLSKNGRVKKLAMARATPEPNGYSRLPVDSESRMPVADEENYDKGTVRL